MNHAVDVVTLYDNLESAGVDVFSLPMESNDAISSPRGYLAVSSRRVKTESHEREILIHEEGHFATATFYQLDSPYTVREHQENIACRYGYRKYFPLEKLLSLMDEGYTEPWELADALGVREEYVREMLEYYTEAKGVDFTKELARRRGEEDDF